MHQTNKGMYEFCRYLNSQHNFKEKLPTWVLAEHFVQFFELPPSPSLDDIIRLCERLGINKVIEAKLGGLRGCFHNFRGQGYEIRYEEAHWVGTQRHTILHEVYEIIECEIHKYYPSFRKSGKDGVEYKAEKFAVCVLMPFETFLNDILTEEFDVPTLQRKYMLAYGSIIIRMKSVLNGITTFFGFIYEHSDMYPYDDSRAPLVAPEDYKANCIVKTRDINCTNTQTRELNALIPKKKSTIELNGNAHRVLLSKQDLYFRKQFSIQESLFSDSFYHIKYQPVVWRNGLVSRIIVTGIGARYMDDLKRHVSLPRCRNY